MHVARPEYEDVTENCTVFGPGCKLSCFCRQSEILRSTYQLVGRQAKRLGKLWGGTF